MSDQAIGLISAGAHILLSFVLALVAVFGSFRIVRMLHRSLDTDDELQNDNIALSILLSATLLGTAIIVREATGPAISTLQTFLFRGLTGLGILRLLSMILLYVVLAVVMAFGATWGALRVFMALTRNIDELAEIRKKNTAVAITVGTAIVVMALFLAGGIGSLMQALIPFPEMQQIEILGG